MTESSPTDDVVVVNPDTQEARTVARGALDFFPGWQEQQQPAQEAQPAQPAAPQQPAARSASTPRQSTQEQ